MIAKEVLNEMARTSESVRRLVSDYSARILLLAESFRILGPKFTFATSGLDDRVNSILVKLSDSVLEDMVYAARKGIEREEDEETVIAWARINTQAQNTVDKYSSHLKHILEGWIAIGFANAVSKGRLQTMIMSYMDNPYITPLWRKAFKDGGYEADIIREGGWTWGKGTPTSPVKGMSLVSSYFINAVYQKDRIDSFARKSAIGYRVHRGSTFDCPYCDELTIGTHPLTEMVLPAHPRCCCYATPVFSDEL